MSDLPRILIARGDWLSEDVTTRCTGCGEETTFSWRKWKGDFTGNRSDFEQFVNWATWYASLHECFLAGRIGYIADPPTPLERHASKPDDPLAYHVDFPQLERREEDPWGSMDGYVVEPEDDDPLDFEPDCLTCGARSWTFVDGDCPKCNPPIEEDEDNLDAWMDEELDLPPLDVAKTLNFRRLYEMGPDESDNYDWAEVRFDFLYDEHVVTSVTGRITVRHPILQEIPRLRSFPPTHPKPFIIDIDYAEQEQRFVDSYLLAVGLYSLDEHGCLRDEKNRCLACLRPGPHLPFYWERDKR